MMLFRREGILPESRLKMVLHENDDDVDNEAPHKNISEEEAL